MGFRVPARSAYAPASGNMMALLGRVRGSVSLIQIRGKTNKAVTCADSLQQAVFEREDAVANGGGFGRVGDHHESELLRDVGRKLGQYLEDTGASPVNVTWRMVCTLPLFHSSVSSLALASRALRAIH